MARFKGCYKNEYARYLMAQYFRNTLNYYKGEVSDDDYFDPIVDLTSDTDPSRRGTANRMPRLNFYAMEIDRSVAEVKDYDHYEFFMAARDEAECPPEFKD